MEFEEAKVEVEQFLRHWYLNVSLFSESSQRTWEASAYALRLQRDPELLIRSANTSSTDFHGLKDGIGLLQRIEQDLPPAARRWLGEYMQGHHKPPPNTEGNKQRRRPRESNKQYVIACAVQHLVDRGLSYSRGRNKKGPKESASDAVAAVMGGLGQSEVGHRTIARIYRKHRKSLEDPKRRLLYPKN